MDFRQIAIPPLVVATIVAVLYGFDAFESFVVDEVLVGHSTRPEKQVAVTRATPEMSQSTATMPKQIESIDPTRTKIAAASVSPTFASAVAAIEPGRASIAASPLLVSRPITTEGAKLTEAAEEGLTEISTDSFAAGEEVLIQAPASMATQATLLEMSDDGQVESAMVEEGG